MLKASRTWARILGRIGEGEGLDLDVGCGMEWWMVAVTVLNALATEGVLVFAVNKLEDSNPFAQPAIEREKSLRIADC